MTQTRLEVIGDKRHLDDAGFRRIRRTYLGGSDAGALLHLSPYSSPLSVYVDKMGLLPPRESEIMLWGTLLEPVIRDEYERRLREETETEVTVKDNPLIYRHTEMPWMGGTVDGIVLWPDGTEEGLEIKTASEFLARDWANNSVPPHYYAQVQHYMALLGWPRVHVACLLGRRLIERVVERDEEYISVITEVERKFWEDHVQPQVMPAPSGLKIDGEILRHLYAEPEESEAAADLSGYRGEIERLEELREQSKEIKARIASLEQLLKSQIGSLESGVATGYTVKWSRWMSTRFDQKRFAADHPDLLLKYKTKEVPGERLSIKRIEKGENK